ncbi:hypothetical protein [Paenibacillus xylaniclasticus]|uniref:hypothetical protein n=1 Tax=Paenibacillus xylaniclasticus TaxID=588083 RepID=UPI000FDCCA77|nr:MULTISPECIES: hypothetical protein [Paenibacillus]GFN31170.1 hypothetical protein PCURB6_14300 [Paenibacillus curdlanolyticus]
MRTLIRTTGIIGLLVIIAYTLATESAQASFFSKVQDIYEAPDKINEIEQKYKEANEELANQLEQSQQATEELARKQEELMAQNQQLMEQNAALQAQIEQAEHKKETFQHKVYTAGAILAGLFAAYFLAIRIWRYVSWRRHKLYREGGING